MEDLNLDLLIEDLNLEVIPAENTSFTSFAHQYIRKLSEGKILTPKKRQFSESSVRQYGASMAMIEEIEAELPKKVEITDISSKMMKAFEIFLIEKNLSLNSVSAYISKIKAIANVLIDDESISFRKIKIATPKERTTKIYLSLNELKQINECQELSEGQRKVWDIALIQIFCGMRYSTLKKFLESPLSYIHEIEGSSFISIIANKTEEECVIPMSDIIVETLKKYNGKIDPPSERYINQTLKIIGKKAGLTNVIIERITIGGEVKERFKKKYEMLSSTTCRRTFLTLIRGYINNDTAIISMSGHANQAQMQHYVRSTKIDRVKPFLNNDFFRIQL